MDFRYFKYLNTNSPYYEMKLDKEDYTFTVHKKKENYKIFSDDHWTYYINKSVLIPEQGWKIHISSKLKYAQDTLNTLANLLIDNNISFKYVKTYNTLFEKNSKYANRIYSGKFITIYPINNKYFVFLLKEISNLLNEFPKGPFILTDKRWYESNVYFRYGAFKSMHFYNKNGEKNYAIRDPKGNLIPDVRAPYYYLPKFIKEPNEIIYMENQLNNLNDTKSNLDKFNILKAIHYSNGGGVYLAEYKSSHHQVIIKEGRPEAGLDLFENDALTRLKKEEYYLNKLKNNSYTVNILESFMEWEHKFIVEEYIEGITLNSWIVNNYPFYSNDNTFYENNCLLILNQLIKCLKSIHSQGIGIGDFSPNNIIITPDIQIKLIDFETADNTFKNNSISLNTLGFSGDSQMNREKSDWFSLLRIARYIFIPIGPVQDISKNIVSTHDEFIEKNYNARVMRIIKNIEEKCKILETKEKTNFIDYYKQKNYTLEKLDWEITTQIKNNIFKNKIIPGDIRQFEIENGRQNILTGGYGLLFTFNRLNKNTSFLDEWIDEQSISKILDMDEGLYTGKTGIATALFEHNDMESTSKILESLSNFKETNDVTLTSGLAGIGLSFIGFSYNVKFKDYLDKAIFIANRIELLMKKNVDIKPFDLDINNIGLMNGWSGVALFYLALYKRNDNNKKWLHLAKQAIDKDLNLGEFNKEGVFHLNDKYRLMPYIDGGSSGLAFPLIELNHIYKKNIYIKELKGIKHIMKSKCFFNCGLFRGTAGIIESYRSIAKYENKNINTSIIDKLQNHLIFSKKEIYVPGDNCLRLSNDIFSGSLGILLIIQSLKSNIDYLWLPVPNIKKVFYSNDY